MKKYVDLYINYTLSSVIFELIFMFFLISMTRKCSLWFLWLLVMLFQKETFKFVVLFFFLADRRYLFILEADSHESDNQRFHGEKSMVSTNQVGAFLCPGGKYVMQKLDGPKRGGVSLSLLITKEKTTDQEHVGWCYCSRLEFKILRTAKGRSKTLGFKRMDAGFIRIWKGPFLGRAKKPMSPLRIIKVGINL